MRAEPLDILNMGSATRATKITSPNETDKYFKGIQRAVA